VLRSSSSSYAEPKSEEAIHPPWEPRNRCSGYTSKASPSTSSLFQSEVLRNVQLRRQPKILNYSKVSKLHIESPAIGHPPKDPLFLIKEESGVELNNDLLVPVVHELQQICNSMEVTSLYPY
jgi:hypothetical protein